MHCSNGLHIQYTVCVSWTESFRKCPDLQNFPSDNVKFSKWLFSCCWSIFFFFGLATKLKKSFWENTTPWQSFICSCQSIQIDWIPVQTRDGSCVFLHLQSMLNLIQWHLNLRHRVVWIRSTFFHTNRLRDVFAIHVIFRLIKWKTYDFNVFYCFKIVWWMQVYVHICQATVHI